MPSNQALQEAIAKYDALEKNIRFSTFGYWVVTYSCAPGVNMSIMVAGTGIGPAQARQAAEITLGHQTGQKVSQ